MPNVSPLRILPPPAPPATPGPVAVVERVVEFLLENLDDAQRADVLARIAPPPPGRTSRARIACVGQRSIKLVSLGEVEFVRSSLAGVHAVTAAGEFYTEETLTALEASTSLVRCHKQFLVNLERIDEIDLSGESVGSIRTRSGKSVPVSRRYRHHVRAALRI